MREYFYDHRMRELEAEVANCNKIADRNCHCYFTNPETIRVGEVHQGQYVEPLFAIVTTCATCGAKKID